jgi:hypothetical protein
MISDLFKKLISLVKTKPDDSVPDVGTDAPDTDLDTAREVETKKDKITSLFSWKWKF